MATNFASWSTSNQYGTYYYTLSYDLLSQSTTNNTSTIRVYGTISLPVYISWSRGSIDINGVSFGLATYYSAGTYTIGYTDITVYHNNDGTGSVYVSGSISTSYLMNGSCGGTIYLPTIPRASQPSCITYPNTTSDVGNIGDTITIHMNRKSTSFTHTVRYGWYDKNETIATNVTDNCQWTIPDNFANDIPNDTKSWGTIFVDTYNGSTLIGTKSVVFWCHVSDADPIFTDFEFEDLNSTTVTLTGDDQAIIKGYSNIDVRIPVADKAVGNKGATITKYRVVVGDYTEDLTYSSSAMVSSSTIMGATTGTIQVYAIDSRGNSTLVTKLASSEVDYTTPAISSSSKIERGQGGVGTSATLTYSGTYWNNSFGDITNAIQSVSYEFKPTSSSTWITGTTNITPTISGSDFSFTGIVRSNASDYSFDIATSYDFRITITDKLSTTIYVFTPLASGTPNIALSDNGTAIGMAYDESEGGAIQLIDDVKLYNRATDTWSPLGAGSGIPNDGVIGYDSNDPIPNGYEEVNIDLLEYSTSEKVIGTWINGKPLYRKVLISSSGNSGNKRIAHGITNIGKVVNISASMTATDYNYYMNNSSPYNFTIQEISQTEVIMNIDGAFSNWTLSIVMEYTKWND